MKKRAMDVILRKRQNSIINSISDDTEALWKSAKTHQQWLQGDPIKTPDGDVVDFSMFDFIVATAVFSKKDMSSDLTMLQRFWITVYPYIDNLIAHQVYYQEQFQELYGIEGNTLKKFALQNLELQCYQKFMKEELGKYVGETVNSSEEINNEFKKYHEKFKAESDSEIEKIKEKEAEWMKKQEAAAERQAEQDKQDAFAATLI